jgi:SynChlorMet cassette radical SAM/SPASM protein ScmF
VSRSTAPAPSVPPLRQIYFYLTDGCNLACRHCWLAPRFDPECGACQFLPVELFETAIAAAKPLGLERVKLTGGEPLLHPELLALVEIIERNRLALTVETNGVLVTPALARRLAALPDCFVSVSLDGPDAASHEQVRGVAGSFAAACQAVRELAAVGLRPQVIMSLLRAERAQVEAMVRLAEELGAASVKLNLVQPSARGEQLHAIGATPRVGELIALGRWVDTELAARTSLELHFDVPLAFRPLRRLARPGGSEICGILGIIGVLASGELALCGIGTHVSELVFGLLGKDDLARVWSEHPVLAELRAGLPDRLQGVCAQCVMRGQCMGCCVAQNHLGGGSFWQPFWFCQEASEIGLFPRSRCTLVEAKAGV